MIRQIIVATVFIFAVLLALITVIQSLRMVEFVVNRGLPTTVVFELLMLRTPSFMTVILPISFFIAVLFVYNKLQDDSELVIMRSTGLSEPKLARPAFVAAIFFMAVAYGIGLYLLPVSFGSFKARENEYRNAYGSVMLQAGRFNTPTDTLTVYIRERVGATELRGILIRDARDDDHPLTILAERGVLTVDGELPRVILFNGNRQEIDSETGRLTLLYFNQYSVSFDAEIPVLQNRYRDPKERFIGELLYPGDARREDIIYHDRLVTEGHQRLSSPLYLPALALIALAFLLTGQHNRRGYALRMLGASTAALAIQASNMGLTTVVAKSLVLVPLMYAVPIGTMVICWIVLMHGLRPRSSKGQLAAGPLVGTETG